MKKKSVGDNIIVNTPAWSFSGDVAQHFDRHVERSIPLYQEGHQLAAAISDFFLSDGSVCYELGCSTGSLTQKLAERHTGKKIKYIAVDQEPDMIAEARKRGLNADINFLNADVLDMEFEPADLIIAYYTVQFIKPKYRQMLIDRIYQSLQWGGAFLMFEKVRGPDARFQDMMTSIYTDHKIQNGFEASEVIAKANSLKGVLEPFSTQGNIDLLKRAGFVDIMSVMKFVCFEGFLAIK